MSDWPQKIRSLLAGSRLEPTREAEIVDELAQHLNDAYDDALMSGLCPGASCDGALEKRLAWGQPANCRTDLASRTRSRPG
jgi:hypothetical protein